MALVFAQALRVRMSLKGFRISNATGLFLRCCAKGGWLQTEILRLGRYSRRLNIRILNTNLHRKVSSKGQSGSSKKPFFWQDIARLYIQEIKG